VKILALDLGTHLGLAHNFNEGKITAESHDLATAKEITAWGKQRWDRRNDPRIHRLALLLAGITQPVPDVVCFEDVQFSSFTKQTQLWASYRTVVWLVFGQKAVLECVPVSTLKKFATGHGGADKSMMAAALYREHPELEKSGFTDDAVDAIFLLKWATKNLSRLKK
jgi:Holliday junction resolvasome RuvABC endonuclease subunit